MSWDKTPQIEGRKMSLRAWAGAARRLAWRHKVTSAVLAACAAVAVAGGTVAATSGQGNQARGPEPAAAPFTLPALGRPSQDVSLSQYAGRPVVVNFFASWCAPCQKETPLLARFYRSEHGRVAVVGLDENDSLQAARKFLGTAGVSYPVGFDPSVQAASAYGVTGLPQTFFLDASHHIVKRVYGALTRADLTSGVALMDAGPHSRPGGATGATYHAALSGRPPAHGSGRRADTAQTASGPGLAAGGSWPAALQVSLNPHAAPELTAAAGRAYTAADEGPADCQTARPQKFSSRVWASASGAGSILGPKPPGLRMVSSKGVSSSITAVTAVASSRSSCPVARARSQVWMRVSVQTSRLTSHSNGMSPNMVPITRGDCCRSLTAASIASVAAGHLAATSSPAATTGGCDLLSMASTR